MVSAAWYPPLPTVPLSSTQDSNISATISSMPTATSVTYHTMEPVTSTEVQESPYSQHSYLSCESQLLEYGKCFLKKIIRQIARCQPFSIFAGKREPMNEMQMQTLAKNAPLPSFFEVQWSSVRVCDPLLTYKPVPTSKEMMTNEHDLLKFEHPNPNGTTSSSAGTSARPSYRLSPTLPTIDQDLLLDGTHEGTMIPTSRNLLFQDDQSSELTTDIWHM